MDTRGKFIEWRFSPVETIGAAFSLASVCVGITLWSVSTFQSKQDAQEVKTHLERRIENIEAQMNTIRTSLEHVARDISYVRGRLEPKQ
jgi:vacuolar-type H+-ATPase subunit I/STV1